MNRRRLAPLLVPLLVVASLVCHGALAGAHGVAQNDGPSPAPLAPQSPAAPGEPGEVAAAGEHSPEYLPPMPHGAALLLLLAALFPCPPGVARRLRAGPSGAVGRALAVARRPARVPAAPLHQVFRL
jgi:hypothetical protein